MKKRIYLSGIVLLLISLIITGLPSCKKDAYRTDGGLAKTTTSLSTYDYLAANSYHYFDTLLMIVDHLGLKDSLNKAGTFFAPTDYAIHLAMTTNNIPSLDSLYKKINSKFLTQYMFTDTSLTLANATTNVATHENWAGTVVGISKIASSYTVATTSLTYYTLQYIKINGQLDGSSGVAADDETDFILKCQTTGINTASGTNLNVLVNNAVLDMMEDTLPTNKTFTININVTQNDDYTSAPAQLDSTGLSAFFGLPATTISNMLISGNDSLIFYAIQPDGTMSKNYTANPPGFWLDNNGTVVSWGSNSYVYAEIDDPTSFIINVGPYPGVTQVGDVYKLKFAIVYLSPDGNTYTATINVNVTIVSQ